MLAFIFALKLFRHFFHGATFTVFTDHQNLLKLNFAKNILAGRLLRWSLRLQDFNFKLVYKPTKLNSDANGMCRLAFTPANLPDEDCALECPLYVITEEDNQILQDEDHYCLSIIDLLKKNDKHATKRFKID